MSVHASPPGTILVVDDNRVNQLLLSRGLEQQGHTVVFARHGREALDLLRGQGFDLMLLDVLMPELDGYQVLAHLRTDERTAGVPVVVLTASATLATEDRVLQAGASECLTKPFDPEELSEAIASAIASCAQPSRALEQLAGHQEGT